MTFPIVKFTLNRFSQHKKEDLASGAEIRHGRGRILPDQIRAAERMAGEPRAAIYLERLLKHATGKL